MADAPLLSIAIPTYNRANCLRLLLESICSQVSPADAARLEVLIFDNCATDETPEVVQEFLPERPYLHYVRSERNIGPDGNFIKAFFAARGKYMWLLGDDELLLEGALAWVLGLCERQEFGCAYLSSIPTPLADLPGFLHRGVQGAVAVRRYSPYAFAQATNYRLTFMSGSVINKEAVLATYPRLEEDIELFSASRLVHLTWILPAILSRPMSCVVTTPLFASTIANSGGYNPVKIFVANLSEMFGHYLSRLDPHAKRFIRRFVLIGWFPKVTFDYRFRGRYRQSEFVIETQDFPEDMRRGSVWWLFHRFVLKGAMPSSALVMLFLKTWHRLEQAMYLARGR